MWQKGPVSKRVNSSRAADDYASLIVEISGATGFATIMVQE
jgi:hypothetical protein